MNPEQVALLKRWRGMILKLVYDGHMKQMSRMDDLALWGLMRDLGQSRVGINHVRTLLQEMESAAYVKFRSDNDDFTGEVHISEIEILPAGRRLVEKMKTDEAVQIV